MALHHKIQPHHHVSVWAISALAVITMSSIYLNTSMTAAEEQGGSEPSEKTRQFFGDSGDDREDMDNSVPAECQQERQSQQGNEAEQMAKIQQQEQLYNRINEIRQTMGPEMPEEQRAQMEAQIAELQSQADALTAGMGDGQQEEQMQEQDYGPSEACKKAIVEQQRSHLQTFKSKINNKILPTFNKIDKLIIKIESKIPDLREGGIEQTKISQIEANIEAIKNDSAVVKDFLQSMLVSISIFEADANNPSAAFDKMKESFDDKKSNNATTAANDLVEKFGDLEKIIEGIKE